MDFKQQVLHYYRVDGLSQREISRRLGIDRKTVRRIIKSYEEAVLSDPDSGLDDYLAVSPKYKPRAGTARVLKEPVIKAIDRWLKENERRRLNGMRKQCLKNKDIHRELLQQGLAVSYSTVCRYVSGKKDEKVPKSKDVFLRIRHEPGDECQFDWGEVRLFLGGEPHTLMMAVFAFPYSKGRYAYLFHRQDTLAFMESHRNFFMDVGGVPRMMVYDNMRVAVVFDDKNKKPTEALQRLSTFYRFSFRFCNARAGWEKGDVERSVDYVRSRAFTTRVDFASMKEAQDWLERIYRQMNEEQCSPLAVGKHDKVLEDICFLQAYPGEFGCFEMGEYKVDKQSTVCIKTNHYSVPEELAGSSVLVKLYSEKIVVYDNSHKKVATHERSYKANAWIVDINHYIATLMKKTSAIQHSEAFHQMPESMRVIYDRHFRKNGKEFLGLVRYVRDNSIAYEEVTHAADILRQRGLKEFTSDHFRVALQAMRSQDGAYREEQINDEFLEIEIGSEDILCQLENAMKQSTGIKYKSKEN